MLELILCYMVSIEWCIPCCRARLWECGVDRQKYPLFMVNWSRYGYSIVAVPFQDALLTCVRLYTIDLTDYHIEEYKIWCVVK